MNRRKKLIRPVAVLLILAVTAVCAETMARLFAAPFRVPPPPKSRAIDPEGPNPFIFRCRSFLHAHIPGSRYAQQRAGYSVEYAINSRGFRGPELPPKSAGVHRLLMVGDSMIEGQGCPFERTVPVLLNGMLEPRGWEVLNLGVQGAGPAYYALNLERYLAFDPDAVLLVLFGNDLKGDRSQERLYPDLPLRDAPGDLLSGRIGTGWAGSAALRIISRAWRMMFPGPAGRLIRRCRKEALAAGLEPGEKPTDMLGRLDEHWQLSTAYLDYLAEVLDDQGTDLFLCHLAIPTRAEQRRELQAGMERLAADWAEARDLEFIALRQAFARSLPDQGLGHWTIAEDGHLNEAGHAAVAELLAPWLRERLTIADQP